jgi:3-hydroxybutyryl-CoA dehydratase
LQKGENLPQLVKCVTQENINLYAQASGDFNPIHVDEDFARKSPYGGTIAHGMLILSYLSQMMAIAFSHGWLSGGKLNVRFKEPARPGDVITVSGNIRNIEQEESKIQVSCNVLCQNQKGEVVITGESSLRLPRK